jgi:hypothetical protein
MKPTRNHLKKLTPILTLGASLLLGLLSFSGMFALWPLLSLAIISFVLSVLYEGEIYQKNINQALDKLLNQNLIAQKIGKEALDELRVPHSNRNDTPIYIQNYDKHSNSKQKTKMEVLLGKILLQHKNDQTSGNFPEDIQKALNNLTPSRWQKRAKILESRNNRIKLFSILTAIVMTLGTTYLLLDTLAVMPYLAISATALPYVVIPLAIISGIAYGFLTYNSLASFLLDHSLTDWWKNFKNQLTKSPKDFKQILFVIGASLIFLLNLTLTLCTAGTWWTLMNQTRKVWPWLQNIGIQFLQSITPLIMGIANLGFNSRNIVETVKAITPKSAGELEDPCVHPHHHHPEIQEQENNWQKYNPFRLLLKMTYMPLRILLFLGHLISIGVTGDQMPGIPAVTSALLGIISEGFEDAHYFFDLKSLFNEHHHHHDEDEEHGHQHSDLPNQLLRILFSPLFLFAALWHYSLQSKGQEHKQFFDCYHLMQGTHQTHEHNHASSELNTTYQKVQARVIVQDQIDRLTQNTLSLKLTQAKISILKELITQLSLNDLNKPAIKEKIASPVLKQHRHSWFSYGKTTTETALEEVENLLQLG